MPMRSRLAFTLLEICLAIAIGMLLLGLAVPSVIGLFAEQKLRASFESFDEFARQAQLMSIKERRAFVLIWEKDGIVIEPDQPVAEDGAKDWPRFNIGEEESIVIERPAALEKRPAMEWMFWRSGTCEPVIATYQGPAGRWVVSYDGLTARGTILEEQFP